MTKGYLFDYGGTLDTGGRHWGRVMWDAYGRHHLPVTEARFREAYVHVERTLGKNPIIGSHYTFRQTLETKMRMQMEFLGLEDDGTAIAADLYARAAAQTAHSRRVLEQLRQQYPLVLVSNFYGNIQVVLREFGLDGLFQSVIESAVVGVRKPDPRIFLLGVEALGLTPGEVTVVGDSLEKDILPAHAAGCHTVWLRGEGWDTPHPDAIRQADRVIDSLDELVNDKKQDEI